MESPSVKSPWRRARNSGIGARMNARKRLARKRKQRCIAIGGDRTVMQITLDTKSIGAVETDALVTYLFEDSEPLSGRVAEIDVAAGGLLKKLASSGELTGKALEFTLIHAPAGLKAARLLLVGAGKKDSFNGATMRRLAGAALRYLKARSVKNFAFLVRENGATADAAQALAEGFITANFETDKYKTEKKNGKEIDSITLVGF